MSLRITQVTQEFSLEGGIESVAFELHRAWQEAGITAQVMTCKTVESGPDIRLVAPWLRRIATRGQGRYFGRMVVVPLFTLAVTHRLQQLGPQDVVLSHGDSFGGDVCVIHSVNRASLEAKSAAGSARWRLNPMHAWVSLRDRIMIGGLRFRRYVAVSNRVASELSRHYGVPAERIQVIPNGVNLRRFSSTTEDRNVTRRELGISPEQKMLLFVGHDFERKGLRHVIVALAKLDNAVRLIVAGADDTASYGRIAQEYGVRARVQFLGARDDIARLYRAADAFVLPSSYESFALVGMEALACGLPVFISRLGGTEDYIEDGLNGRFIERDADSIAAVLRAAFADPANLVRMREGAVATAQRFAWPTIAERYRRLLDEVQLEKTRTRHKVIRFPGEANISGLQFVHQFRKAVLGGTPRHRENATTCPADRGVALEPPSAMAKHNGD